MPTMDRKRGQFELGWLFVITAAVAIVLTAARSPALFELLSWPPTLLFVAMTSTIFTSASGRIRFRQSRPQLRCATSLVGLRQTFRIR